ncbi:MAG: response regulator [Chloroflexota bacterium]
MVDKKLESLLDDAVKAYQRRDKRKGAQLLDEILRKDFNHPGAWDLLHRLFGGGREMEDFRRAFTLQYYPDRINDLHRLPAVDAFDASGLFGEAPPVPPAPAAPPVDTPLSPPITPDSLVSEPPARKPGFFARLFGGLRRKPRPEAGGAPAPAAPPAPGSEPPPGAAPAAPAPGGEPAVRRVTQSGGRSMDNLPRASTMASRSVAEVISDQAPATPLPAIEPALKPAGQGKMEIFSRPPAVRPAGAKDKIHVVVVDDIPQTRETVIRTLRFQEDIEVDGTATNGLQAIDLVKELRPDVVIMDVNMPDMDGITATGIIKKEVPYAQIIILTVQDDVDYIRRAMNAGARDFLAKPPMIEELVAAVQRAGEFARRERENVPPPVSAGGMRVLHETAAAGRGKIITLYSPRGGSGCTTLAANLAVALYTADNRVVVVDANLQFGDVAIFFNVQAKNTILDLAPRVEELDNELVEEVLAAHESGVKILAPSRPERSELVTGPQFSQLLSYLSGIFAYVIVDTPRRLTDVTLAALDSSDLVALVTTQDIPSISRMRKFLDLAPALNLDPKRLVVVMNQFDQRVSIDPEKVGNAFNQPVAAVIPASSEIAISAANRGEPFMLVKENAGKPIGRGVLALVEALRHRLNEVAKAD